MSFFRTLPTKLSFNTDEKIQIANAELTSGDFAIAIDILNATDSYITNIEFAVKFKSIEKSYLFNGREFYFAQSVNVKPYTRYFLDPFLLDERFYDARAIDIYISKYTCDGKTITCPGKKYEMNLPVIPEKKRAQIKDTLGDGIKTYGENQIDFWRCACGFINEKEHTECDFCGRNKSFVLNNLTEPLINSKILNVIENTRSTSDINLKTLETHLTQTNLSKIAPNIESLKNDRTNDVSLKKPRRFSGKIIFFSLILIFILAIISIFIINFATISRNKNKIEDARSLALSGEYKEALEIYKEATKEKTTPGISNEIEKLKKLVQSDEFYKKGIAFYKDGNYIDSAHNFKKVIQEDEKNYNSAQDKLLSIDNIILTNVKNLYTDNKVSNALSLLNSYLEVVPESAKATTLKKEIESKNAIDLNKSEAQKENFEKENDYTDAAQTAKKSSELLHTYRNVVTEKANLRREPSVDSEIIKILDKGTELYILETKIEQGERIWCHVEVKSTVSGENINGWISDKTLN
ncbi:MAG: SH3 domain-containing protein [Peptoniphilus sp.]|uniref:SH3 domain-containing protein n=1 Tax=Peptoniphilus sp. TaxID=1971214 RepID=UPI0025FFFC70|nr:SH3 domain-containing protein [Peptoniphilus sp.]MCI5643529.1 SH3 domain-containing protein [Peptoniphilus sp.]MDY3902211.1 SH3 domain-containing protein [Peptoniphilus sp.]